MIPFNTNKDNIKVEQKEMRSSSSATNNNAKDEMYGDRGAGKVVVENDKTNLNHHHSCCNFQKGVRFSEIIIHEHPIIVGDNPGGVKGPPLTISWNRVSSQTFHIDDFEEFRESSRSNIFDQQVSSCYKNHTADLRLSGMSASTYSSFSESDDMTGVVFPTLQQRRRRRKTMAELKLPSTQREEILRGMGYSRSEINQGTKMSTMIRNQRRKTNSAPYPKMEEVTDKARRVLANVLTLGAKKRRERAYLKECV